MEPQGNCSHQPIIEVLHCYPQLVATNLLQMLPKPLLCIWNYVFCFFTFSPIHAVNMIFASHLHRWHGKDFSLTQLLCCNRESNSCRLRFTSLWELDSGCFTDWATVAVVDLEWCWGGILIGTRRKITVSIEHTISNIWFLDAWRLTVFMTRSY